MVVIILIVHCHANICRTRLLNTSALQVADFGMSRIHTETKVTAAQGTITHMPPELIRHGRLHRLSETSPQCGIVSLLSPGVSVSRFPRYG